MSVLDAIAVNEEKRRWRRAWSTAPSWTNGARGATVPFASMVLRCTARERFAIWLASNPKACTIDLSRSSRLPWDLRRIVQDECGRANARRRSAACQGDCGERLRCRDGGAAGLAAALGANVNDVPGYRGCRGCALQDECVNRRNRAANILRHDLASNDPIKPTGADPRIERNAMGAGESNQRHPLAMRGDGTHRISLDQAIDTPCVAPALTCRRSTRLAGWSGVGTGGVLNTSGRDGDSWLKTPAANVGIEAFLLIAAGCRLRHI